MYLDSLKSHRIFVLGCRVGNYPKPSFTHTTYHRAREELASKLDETSEAKLSEAEKAEAEQIRQEELQELKIEAQNEVSSIEQNDVI